MIAAAEAALGWVARNARAFLSGMILFGLALPEVSGLVRPFLGPLVGATLWIVALRIGARAAVGALSDLRRTALQVLAFQMAMPLMAIGALASFGAADTTLALILVLALAASSIAGAPSITVLVDRDPAPALRLTVLGTALLPLTILPVLWASPLLGSAGAVIAAALRLIAVIGGAVALGFAMRPLMIPPRPDPARIAALDGLAAILIAALLLGLMAEAGSALWADPLSFLGWLALAFALNFGLQIGTYLAMDPKGERVDSAAAAIVAGNRNIAIFIVALPPEVLAPAMIFIGAYQVPMYTTPLVLRGFYRPRR